MLIWLYYSLAQPYRNGNRHLENIMKFIKEIKFFFWLRREVARYKIVIEFHTNITWGRGHFIVYYTSTQSSNTRSLRRYVKTLVDLFGTKLSVSKFFILQPKKWEILSIIIGVVHQIMIHCPILWKLKNIYLWREVVNISSYDYINQPKLLEHTNV